MSTSSSFPGDLPPLGRDAWCNDSAAIAVRTYSVRLCQTSHSSEAGPATVCSEGVSVFFLIKVLLLPIWLPFKILLEIAKHSGRRRHYQSRRRSAPARRTVTSTRPHPMTSRQPRPDTRAHWRSLSTGRKALIIAFLSSLTFLVVAVLAVAGSGSAGPSGSPSPSAPATGVAQAAGVASAITPSPARTHRHRKHLRRRHRHVIAPSAPAPAPAGCYPTAASGNCYEPGQFCASADAGMSGVAGDGARIICEDNNGLRWEPA